MHPDFDHKTRFHNNLQALNPIFHESIEEVDITETYILNGKITGQKFASIHPCSWFGYYKSEQNQNKNSRPSKASKNKEKRLTSIWR
jgi:hypothetical protein